MAATLKVLVLAADPDEGSRGLRIDHEIREMLHAIRRGKGEVEIDVAAELAVRVHDVRDALLRHDSDVVHVAAHGYGGKGIVLDEGALVSGKRLAELFREFPKVRVVVLNACKSAPTGKALSEVVDYVIAMERAIDDGDAVVFASGFYAALAFGRTVPVAFRTAKASLALDPDGPAPVPVLMVRDGAGECPLTPGDPAPESAGARADQLNRVEDTESEDDAEIVNAATGAGTAQTGSQANEVKGVKSGGSLKIGNTRG